MTLVSYITLFSGLSFIAYALMFVITPKMRVEFDKLNIRKYSIVIVTLEALGGLGLIVGLFIPPILILSSGGLTILMLLALIMRLYNMNNFKFMYQALFFFLVNGYIFTQSI